MAKRDDLTPIAYYRRSRVSGYLRRDGRIVDPYYRLTWIVEFPVPLEQIDLTDFGRERLPAKPSVEPVRELAHADKPSEWINAEDYVLSLYDEYEFFEIHDAIYRVNEHEDFVSMSDGLVWEHPLRVRTIAAMGLEEIYLVRVWVLLYNENRDEYFSFSRARSLLLNAQKYRESVDGAYSAVLEIYDDLVKWANEFTDYIEVKKEIAWTCWGRPTQADGLREMIPTKHPYHLGQDLFSRVPLRPKRKKKKHIRLFTGLPEDL